MDQSRGPTRWIGDVLDVIPEASWTIRDGGYVPALEHEVESRLALSNGLIGVRASLDIPTGASRPATLLAGLFDRSSRYGLPGLVSIPDWTRFRALVGDDELSIEEGETLKHVRTLDMRRGILISDWAQRTPSGYQVHISSVRLASQRHRHQAFQSVRIETAEAVPIELTTWLASPTGRLVLARGDANSSVWRTAGGGQNVAIAQAAGLWAANRSQSGVPGADGSQTWRWHSKPGQHADFVRRLAVFAGPDEEANEVAALSELKRPRGTNSRRLFDHHVHAWQRRWDDSDVSIEGDAPAREALRFAAYHLVSAANPESALSSVGARALTGDGYLGHVFWDTEIFLAPFYTLTWPEAARALLEYRYRTLPAAREKAARLGYRGALYAWESADTGEEVTPTHAVGPAGEIIPILNGLQEHHISADIAYAVWQYWHATHDFTFLERAGAEILLDTARFWASRARAGGNGRFHIDGVIGPDEYHENVDDNAYTNHMARWNLLRGLDVATLLRDRAPQRWQELQTALGLSDAELDAWRAIADGLVTGLDEERGLFEQFRGFFGLDAVGMPLHAAGAPPIDVLLGRERIQRSRVIKQPDVLMLFALLHRDYAPGLQRRNFDYYAPICAHGSSLSHAMHGLVAARLGRTRLAHRHFEHAVAIDMDNTMGNSAAGVHVGALGGLWQLAVFGFGGVDISGEELSIAPRLPPGWSQLEFALHWRGRKLRIHIERDKVVAATLERGRPLTLHLGPETVRMQTGASQTVPLRPVRRRGNDQQ